MKSSGAKLAVVAVGTFVGALVVAAVAYLAIGFFVGRTSGLSVSPVVYYDLRGVTPGTGASETSPSSSNETELGTAETEDGRDEGELYDLAGTWTMVLERWYTVGEGAGQEDAGSEFGTFQMEVPGGEIASVTLMPELVIVTGEEITSGLVQQPRSFPAERDGNTLRIYLDVDDFYVDGSLLVYDTTDPEYLEFPLSPSGVSLQGEYGRTWDFDFEGSIIHSQIRFQVYR